MPLASQKRSTTALLDLFLRSVFASFHLGASLLPWYAFHASTVPLVEGLFSVYQTRVSVPVCIHSSLLVAGTTPLLRAAVTSSLVAASSAFLRDDISPLFVFMLHAIVALSHLPPTSDSSFVLPAASKRSFLLSKHLLTFFFLFSLRLPLLPFFFYSSLCLVILAVWCWRSHLSLSGVLPNLFTAAAYAIDPD